MWSWHDQGCVWDKVAIEWARHEDGLKMSKMPDS